MHHPIRRTLGVLVSAALLSTGLVTLQAGPARAAYPVPPTPAGLPQAVEALQPYMGQTSCDPVAKPGVSAFRSLLLKTYTDSGSLGIVRDCGSGGQSEHKEGRAFDWKMSVNSARQKAEVSTLTSWLLKTDASGNTYAMARRFGIMYMIWNHRIWKAYDAAKGWQDYTGPNPHTDHVHFSFGWNGAHKTTSYWDNTVAPLDFGPNGPPHITPVRSPGNIATIRKYGTTTLANHSSGAAVTVMQRALKVSPADGDFGPDTGLHVLRFQVDQKLPQTQRFGPTEWTTLFPYPIAPFGVVDPPAYVLGNAVVRGWALDADTKDPLQVRATVDGAAAGTTLATVPRSDVGASYPEWGSAHGFVLLLPLLDGAHQVCITAVNAPSTPGTDTALGCFQVSAQHNPVGEVESLTSALGSVTLTGWALDPDSPDVLPTALTVDDAPSAVVPQPVTRTDIGTRFAGSGTQHGVRAVLDLVEGTHEVCLLAPNAAGTDGSDATVGCRTVTVAHTPAAALYYARRSTSGVSVRGWALDPDVAAPATVDVLSDGAVVGTTTASSARTDIPAAYSANGTAHGFFTSVALPDGTHQVCVRVRNATGTAGKDLTLPCSTLVVTHAASGVLTFLGTVPGGAVKVAGDAYDPDATGPSKVTINVDGKLASAPTAGASSTTADKRWPGYGALHGFSSTLSLARGRHTVCVWAENLAGTAGTPTLMGCRAVIVHDAVGDVRSVSRSGRTVTYRGWAVDPDTKAATRATLVLDGRVVSTVLARVTRSYLGTSVMPGYGSAHGVDFVRTLARGTHQLCLVTQNASGTTGVSRKVGCRTVTVP